MTICVATGLQFTSKSFGPGAALCVGAVSRDLLLGCQGLFLGLTTGLLRRNSAGFGAPVDCLPQKAASVGPINVHSVENQHLVAALDDGLGHNLLLRDAVTGNDFTSLSLLRRVIAEIVFSNLKCNAIMEAQQY